MILLLTSKFVWNEKKCAEYESVGSGLHPEIERLFLERGLGSADALKAGTADQEVWHDPFDFKDMPLVVDRINRAVADQEKILVYGDYDADGTTATVILMRALRHIGANVGYYIPHRFFEGYGPNEDAFLQAMQEGNQLIITVDCGISAVAEAELLKAHGVDLIIIDHHQPKETIPHAVGVVHPECDQDYPFDYLAGAGVALKVAEALRDGELPDDDVMLAMFGTVGDVVDLVDENRSIVKRGLAALRTTQLPGVLALLRVAEINQYETDETTVGFAICPRLNAPGRMDDASMVVDLLLAEDEFMALEYAKQVDAMNSERKAITNQIVEEAASLAEAKPLDDLKALVLYHPDWHEGVLGIVAAKMVDQFGKAVVVLTMGDEGLIKGSARAPEGMDILKALVANESLLERYGGHEGAAGMTLKTADPAELEVGLNLALAESIAVKTLTVDLSLPLEALDFKWLDDLQFLAPFGQGNKRPIVKLSGVTIKDAKRIGATHEHLKFTMQQGKSAIDTVFFGGAKTFIFLTSEAQFDVLCEVEINEWNGNKKLQARILDVKCEAVQLVDLRNQKLDAEFGAELTDGFLIKSHTFESKEKLKAAYVASGAKNVIVKPLETMTMPTRESFIFVYQTLKKHAPFNLTVEIVAYFEKSGISKAMLTFIVKVFTEVGLVSYESGVVTLNDVNEKVDFKTAPSYISRAQKVAVHEFLELSTATEILDYLTQGVEEK